jgi:hypothetical protein
MRHHSPLIIFLLLTTLLACHSVSKNQSQGKSAGVENSRFQKDLFSTSEDYEDVLVQNTTH